LKLFLTFQLAIVSVPVPVSLRSCRECPSYFFAHLSGLVPPFLVILWQSPRRCEYHTRRARRLLPPPAAWLRTKPNDLQCPLDLACCCYVPFYFGVFTPLRLGVMVGIEQRIADMVDRTRELNT